MALKAAKEFNIGLAESLRIQSMEQIALAHNWGMIPSSSDREILKRQQGTLGIMLENMKRVAGPKLDDQALMY
ncbi:MAG: hypothetical protein Q7S01_00415 [bacterium]|nr:hypothetical protein [bacterium]